MRNFLLGVLVGVALLSVVMGVVHIYADMNIRVMRIEGYIIGLDQMLRAAR